MKNGSIISTERVRLSRQQRFNPIRGLSPAKLTSALEEFRGGNLRRASLLWDAQLSRDPILKTVSAKRVKSPARCPWEVLVIDDTPRAKEHAAALRWFYNNLRVTSALDPNEQGGFSLLVRQMLTAIGMKYAVHELVLRPRNNQGVELPLDLKDTAQGSFKPDTLVTAELRFCPLWWFENLKGPLAFLASDWATEGQPLKPGEWIVTVGDGLMEPSSVADMFKRTSLHDWLNFNEKFGTPGLLGKTGALPDTPEFAAMKEALKQVSSDWAAVVSGSDTIDLLEVKNGGALPFQPMVDLMDRYIATLWRGGDLSTLSGSKPGDNSGASLQGGEEQILVEDDCQLVTETLNEQLDKIVLRYLFGEEPLAYVKLIAPKQANLDATIKKVDFLVKYGVPVGVNQLREGVSMPAPVEGEELVQAPAPITPPANVPPTAPAALENEQQLDQAARDLLAEATATAVQALLKRLHDANEITDPTLRIHALQGVLQEYDQIKADLQKSNPIASALLKLQASALVNGLEDRPKLS